MPELYTVYTVQYTADIPLAGIVNQAQVRIVASNPAEAMNKAQLWLQQYHPGRTFVAAIQGLPQTFNQGDEIRV